MFKKIFGSKVIKEKKILPWQQLTTVNQLNTILEASKLKTQVIFKHSTRCGISSMVLNQFTALYNLNLNADLYYLDLLNFREVSDACGFKFQVMHQSPQLIVIRNAVTVSHASHGAINELDLQRFS